MNEADAARPWTPVQLRIGFTAPTSACSMTLSLEGLSVSVSAGDDDLAASYLSAVGVTVEIDAVRGLRFPVKDLRAVGELPDQVSVRSTSGLSALLEAVMHPPLTDATISVTMDGPTLLNLSWYDGHRRFDEPFPLSYSPALIATGIPFVAATDTWERVLEASRMPVVVGRARVNLDGYVEILVSAPQKIEAAPLPGLFRVDATHYGIALHYASWISASPGFSWEGPQPVGDASPDQLAEPTIPLSDHVRSDLRTFVDALARERARAVVWPAGIGRRVFCLAGVESLRSFPLLVVCGPHAVWSWQRNVALFGRSVSMHHDRDDVRIMTYEELSRSPRVNSPATVIFDDLDRALRDDPSLLDHLSRFDGLLDAIRISCSQEFPEDPAEQVRLMSVIRPGEFRADIPVALRYPGAPERRLTEHLQAYTMRRKASAGLSQFSRSAVEILETPRALVDVFAEIRSSTMVYEDKVGALMGATSCGSALAMSPKLSRAVALARSAHGAGRSVAVVTQHARTAVLLKGLLRPLPVHEYRNGSAPLSGVTIVRSDQVLADLRDFDEVVFIDYPWSTAVIDSMVGDAGAERAPTRVTVLHLADSIDDRVAVVAAKRRERAGVVDQYALPTATELRWMLAF